MVQYNPMESDSIFYSFHMVFKNKMPISAVVKAMDK